MKLRDYLSLQHGASARLARMMGVHKMVMSAWALEKRRVPLERAIEIERLTDGAVTVEDLRPDLLPVIEALQRRPRPMRERAAA